MNGKRTWLAISTVLSNLKDFSMTQAVAYTAESKYLGNGVRWRLQSTVRK